MKRIAWNPLLSPGLACLLGIGLPANAATTHHKHGDQTTQVTNDKGETQANSSGDYLDDRMSWDHNEPAWSHEAMQNDAAPDYCLPRNTAVIAQASSLTTAATSDNTKDDSPSTEKKYLAAIVSPNHFLNIFGKLDRDEAQKALNDHTAGSCEGVQTPKPLPVNDLIYVKTDDGPQRWGWEYGALVVPFKMQLGGKHSFSGSASVGGYLGYALPMWNSGVVLSPVAFAGASSISVPTNSGKKKDNSETMAGLSYGLGIIGRVKDGFQVGIIFGKDHVDSRNYQYNDKTWISFEIGYSFAQ